MIQKLRTIPNDAMNNNNNRHPIFSSFVGDATDSDFMITAESYRNRQDQDKVENENQEETFEDIDKFDIGNFDKNSFLNSQ